MTKEDRQIRRDRMRYTKNTVSSGLALAAILFDVFYFVSIYKSDVGQIVGNFYYKIVIGASIVYNLVFMLLAFLSSEGVKNYKMGYSFVLFVIGILQVARIFYLPMQAHSAVVTVSQGDFNVMKNAQFIRVVTYLSLSAFCCITAAVTSFVKNCALASHMASLKKEKTA